MSAPQVPMSSPSSTSAFAARLQNVPVAWHRLGRVWSNNVPSTAARQFAELWPVWCGGIVLGVLFAVGLDVFSVSWKHALPGPIRAFFNWITDFGKSGWLLFSTGGLCLVLLFADWRNINRRLAAVWAEIGLIAGFAFLSIVGSGIITNLLKVLVGRSRPTEFDSVGAFSLTPLQFGYRYASFPSGHSTTMGALAVIVALVIPRLRVPAFLLCALVASSRVFIGVHFPSDVVAGFMIGAAYTWFYALALAQAGIVFARQPGGTIRARVSAIGHIFRQPGGFSMVMGSLWLAVLGARPRAT